MWEEIGFLQYPQKAYIFYIIRFVYVSQKKFWNKLCLEPHDTYILFRTFFSHVNTKRFFLSSDPLHQPWLPTSFLCFTVFYCILYGISWLRTFDRSDVNRCVQRRVLLESFVCQTIYRWSHFTLSINKEVKNYWTWIKLATSESSLPH